MIPSEIHLCYFSATGTTCRVATAMGEALSTHFAVPLTHSDFTTPAAREQVIACSADALVIVGVPVYAGRVPNLILPYIESLRGNGALAVPLVLYGNRAYDDALIELRNVLEGDGFRCIAGAAFVGEHSFGRAVASGRPDAEDLEEAKRFADALGKKLQARDQSAAHVPVHVPGNEPIKPYFRPMDAGGNHIDIRKVKPETTEACIKCQWCAKHCPMGAISLEEPAQIPGICIKCNACVKGCPKEAKIFTDPGYLFHQTDITTRFQNPRRDAEWYL